MAIIYNANPADRRKAKEAVMGLRCVHVAGGQVLGKEVGRVPPVFK